MSTLIMVPTPRTTLWGDIQNRMFPELPLNWEGCVLLGEAEEMQDGGWVEAPEGRPRLERALSNLI